MNKMTRRNDPPRIAAIHDLSCFGRCALTVVLPVLSAMGSQAIPIPTALLSTHTGGFESPYFHDLTADMREIIGHFSRLGISFDAIYSGFLGSAEQIQIVSDFIDRFGSGKPVLVDPVIGDAGILYSTYTLEMVEGMTRLCKKADIITPNLTEACFLTGATHPTKHPESEQDALSLASRLCERLRETVGDKKIVITSIRYGNMIANAFKIPGEDCRLAGTPYSGRDFPGAGELFASVLLGSIMQNAPFEAAVRKAAAFTLRVISETQKADTPAREGVLFEKFLGELADEPRGRCPLTPAQDI
jgi:pyridoxine kinase